MPVRSKIALPASRLIRSIAYSAGSDIGTASGAGFDTVDVAACTKAGVIVVNQAGGNRESVAEHTLGLMLALTKRITDLLAITKLLTVFETYESENDAVQSFSSAKV